MRLKRKAKFWTIHNINSDYKTRVRNKHNHQSFGNRSPPQEPVNRLVNDLLAPNSSIIIWIYCMDCPEFCFKKVIKSNLLKHLPMIQCIDEDHSSTLERDVGAGGDQSWRTSIAK